MLIQINPTPQTLINTGYYQKIIKAHQQVIIKIISQEIRQLLTMNSAEHQYWLLGVLFVTWSKLLSVKCRTGRQKGQ